jgi:hypothetical protein
VIHLFVSTADSDAAQGQPTGRNHLAFQARDRATVDAFHRAALAAGGKDNGAPGERPYHPGYVLQRPGAPDRVMAPAEARAHGNDLARVFSGGWLFFSLAFGTWNHNVLHRRRAVPSSQDQPT